MWHPPERIRHAPLRAHAGPTPLKRAASPPVQPASRRPACACRIAPGCPRWCRGAPPRTASSPTTCSTGTSASPTGQPGVIVVEATGVRDIPSGPLLRIGDDRFIPGLRAARRDRAARERRPHEALHPDHRLPRPSAAGRREKPSSAATCRSPMRIGGGRPGRMLTARADDLTAGPRARCWRCPTISCARCSRRARSRRWTSGFASA